MQAVNVCEVGSRVPGCGTATGCRQQATGSGACVRIYMHPKNGREECTKESTGLHTRCLCVSARQHGLSVDGEATSECPVSQANCRRALQATMCQPSNHVLHHTVYCITMYCTVRHCIVLYCMVRYCTPLYCCIAVLLYCCTALYCCIAVLYCTALLCPNYRTFRYLFMYHLHHTIVSCLTSWRPPAISGSLLASRCTAHPVGAALMVCLQDWLPPTSSRPVGQQR